MRGFRLVLLAVLDLCLIGPAGAALITLDAAYPLLPDAAGQTISIYVSGGDSVVNMNLTAEIGGGVAGPVFTGLDITSADMVFEGATNLQTRLYGRDDSPEIWRYANVSVLVTEAVELGTLDERQLLAVLTVSTIGLFGGTFDLKLNDMNDDWGADTNFGDKVPLTITNGTIEIQGEEVPEPASILLMAGLMACGAPALVLHRRRKRMAASTVS